jgi:hypothetical protein
MAGEPRLDPGACPVEPRDACACWPACGVAAPPPRVVADKSIGEDVSVKVGLVTVRRSLRELKPSGTRGLLENCGHSECLSPLAENEFRGDVWER